MILEQVETLENKELCDEYAIVETDLQMLFRLHCSVLWNNLGIFAQLSRPSGLFFLMNKLYKYIFLIN